MSEKNGRTQSLVIRTDGTTGLLRLSQLTRIIGTA